MSISLILKVILEERLNYVAQKHNRTKQVWEHKKSLLINNSTDKWQGGHIGKSTGYKYIRVNGKDIGEHILVMTKHLGRRLKRNEVVHHVDGNKLNNSLENLQLMTRQEHSRLHSSLRRTNAPCLRCGKERTIHARGLCNNCYRYCLKHNQLSRYEYTRKHQEKQIQK